MLPGFKIAMSKSGEHVGTNRWCLCVDICRMAAVRAPGTLANIFGLIKH